MAWQDLGLIFPVNKLSNWAVSHCYVPTPVQLKDRIRVYAAFWDENKHGRLGYVDVSTQDPTQIIDYAQKPLLTDSTNGQFDCDGVTPLSAVICNDSIRLYYAGWKKFDNAEARYTIYTGLAIGDLEGNHFNRYTDDALIGPRYQGELVRTGGMTLNDGNGWRTWFASYYKSIDVNGRSTPSYTLSTMSSDDGISWDNNERCIFPVVTDKIMGYGRSAIWKENNIYHGLFAVRAWSGRYNNICYSTSNDGLNWSPLSLDGMAFKPEDTCDQQTEVCFPSVIRQENRLLMFYNGNDFGKAGLRVAIWND